ncbi:SIR2 family protein [Salinimicrobium xinjiangense]|uniref:SIR2 family protein n=1 Tax=Salinimicrobium xinjiangense TaxID=438596 RepID=UPI000409A2CB|nr:SIR2 family protein [Salinimicrobium xinjiangense]
MNLKNNQESIEFLEENIFPSIYDENTILFLGAGASYTKEKNYLGSTLINYYQEKLQSNLETRDLVEFVDRASQLDKFSRHQFDQYVKTLLQGLKPETAHKKIVSLGWRQIITTNMDLLIETAYNSIYGTPDEYKKIYPVRDISEYQSSIANDQIKYIKLNGCLSDLSKYKFIFSSQDFLNNKEFYNLVLSNFSVLTNEVKFLSIGYSFTDGISKRLLDELNKNNLKNNRKIFNVDPFPNESLIPYLEEKNVITIRMTAEQFFKYYEDWLEAKHSRAAKALPKTFYKKSEGAVQISNQLRMRLMTKLKQLHKNNFEFQKPESFYKGEQPKYSIILEGHDIIKKEPTLKIVQNILNSEVLQNLIPVLFISGSHGIGKTTSTLRAIDELQKNYDYTAFELIEVNGLRAQDMEDLFSKSSSEKIILLADNVERHTFFKELMNFRLSLSEHQFNRNIVIVAPIRENMLAKNLKSYSYSNTRTVTVNHKLSETEIDELIIKLKTLGLIHTRDKQEENQIKNQIRTNYDSDPYVTMLSIIENSTLYRAVAETLSAINPEARKAFEYTSLLYQFNIPMPASILKKIIKMDWEEFKDKVLKIDCKGLLLNEIAIPVDIKEDLIFRTKHRIISSTFVERNFKNEDQLFKGFLKVVRNLSPNDEHAKIAVDLFKAIRNHKIFTTQDKLSKLYDEAALVFATHPLFNIHYAMNLQHRRDINSLKKAEERLMLVDSSLEYRSNAITHRRGVIAFAIAKYYHHQDNAYLREEYLQSATEFFEIKRMVDPFSSYSYSDFLKLEMWKIKNLELEEDEVLKQHLLIQDLFLKAHESVVENVDFITKLRVKYVHEIKVNQFSKAEVLKHLEELYENNSTRIYALIFKLNTLENPILEFGEQFLPNHGSEDIVEELENYKHLDIVQKAIFEYHCNRLYNIDSRMAMNNFDMEKFERDNFFKYHFYNYIKESYNQQYHYSRRHLNELRKEYKYINPSLKELWIDDETLEPKLFNGNIKHIGNYQIYIRELGKDLYMFKSEFNLKPGDNYECNIIFTVKGLRVQLLKKLD